MTFAPQLKIPATYMRGGTSKGIFFLKSDLPAEAQVPGEMRDNILLRVIGSPDPYGKHTDGMGGATSSTSKAVIISKSESEDHDVDYLFGQVAIDKPFIDWSGNCGNLTAAVGAFAVHNGLIDEERIPESGQVVVRVWQVNIKKTIHVIVPIRNSQVQETGDFVLDGVTFPAAEIVVSFKDPAASDSHLFPTGNLVDQIEVPRSLKSNGVLDATLITAGIPTVFVRAKDLGLTGAELQDDINSDTDLLKKFEQLRALGAQRMGLISDLKEAEHRQHTPKIAIVAPPESYVSSSGKLVECADVDLLVRALSMGKLHHAMMGTAAVSIGAAAAIPGTLVSEALSENKLTEVTFGHPSGVLKVGAIAGKTDGVWKVEEASMSRSARILMEGFVRIPNPLN